MQGAPSALRFRIGEAPPSDESGAPRVARFRFSNAGTGYTAFAVATGGG
jgi:hypothetical protein